MQLSVPHSDEYRLVLIAEQPRRILAERLHGALALPRIRVPRWTRPAQQITGAIRHRWQIDGIVLDMLGDGPGAGNLVLIEVRDQRSCGNCALESTNLSGLSDGALTPEERYAIEQLIERGSTDRGPFSRLGWIDEALRWIQQWTKSCGTVSGWTFDQFNASATGSLIRFRHKDGQTYWFKSGGMLNPNELGITTTIAKLFPKFVPELISIHTEWNAWLMKDEGAPLPMALDRPESLDDIVLRLSELQRESSEHIPRLIQEGCHDHRIPRLVERMPRLIPYLGEAMLAQVGSSSPRIRAERLRHIQDLFEQGASRLSSLGIPDTLMHCDFSLDNILVSNRGGLFIDWAQASVGLPFVTFEQLRVQLMQDDRTTAFASRITALYWKAWSEWIPAEDIEQAFALAPLFAAACDLCCRPEWLTLDAPHHLLSQSYARTLARRLDRAAQQVEDGTLLCA